MRGVFGEVVIIVRLKKYLYNLTNSSKIILLVFMVVIITFATQYNLLLFHPFATGIGNRVLTRFV